MTRSALSDIVNQKDPGASRERRMQRVVDTVWHTWAGQNVSWVGFYLDQPNEPDDRRLILGPHRDTPACSPIGLHGVCGKTLVSREIQIVPDVLELGDDYVACDPRDRSELVIPCFDSVRTCWGVLDLDSFEIDAFSNDDAEQLLSLLQACELTTCHAP